MTPQDFQTHMLKLGYKKNQLEFHEDCADADYVDDDGDAWTFHVQALAMKHGQRKFHCLTEIGLMAEVNGNSVTFFSGAKGDTKVAQVDLGNMAAGKDLSGPEQRYMRILCGQGGDIDAIEDRFARLTMRARAMIIDASAKQFFLHSLRYDGENGARVVLVLQPYGTHAICQMGLRFDVKPIAQCPFQDPGQIYEVFVAASEGVTMQEAEEILLNPKNLRERLFGPVLSEDEESVAGPHPHQH